VDSLWIGLTAGLLAFAHCSGMCGGFALHLSRNESRISALARLFAWNFGRTSSYVFLGAMAGYIGEAMSSRLHLSWFQAVLAYIAGAVMVLMGLTLVGAVPHRWRRRLAAGPEGLLASLFRPLLGFPSIAGALVLGLATGLLPCPIVTGLLALSVQRGSVLAAMVLMAALGLGTLGPLVLVGLTGQFFQLRFRRWAAPAGATVLVLLGMVTALRATPALHHLLGHHGSENGSVQQPCHAGHPTPGFLDESSGEGRPGFEPQPAHEPGRL
jgi:sulfite exporter TauE/SafE